MQRTDLDLSMQAAEGCPAVRWRITEGLVPYEEAVAEMERQVAAIADGTADELVWLVEHPPLYTAGTSADSADLIQPDRFPVFATGRGGEYTYHGPGQRVAYVMLDLKRRRQDVRAYVAALEEVVIRTLDSMNVRGERREDRVGVWVRRPDKGEGHEDKIAAIGVPLGELSRPFDQCRSGPRPFFGHRALWNQLLWCDEPCRSRAAGDDDRCRHAAARCIRTGFRRHRQRQSGLMHQARPITGPSRSDRPRLPFCRSS